MVKKSKDGVPSAEEHPGGSHIAVTAQQSRYALDAVDAPASKEVCALFKPLLVQVLLILTTQPRSSSKT